MAKEQRKGPKPKSQHRKPGPKAKNKTERTQRRNLVAALRVDGKTLFEIAEQIGVAKATVGTDLKVIERQWLEEAKLNFSAKRLHEEAELLRIKEQAWDSFFASCGEGQPEGDPRFLVVALKAEEQIIALYKLDDAEIYWRNEVAGGDSTGAIEAHVVEVVVETREEVRATMSFAEWHRFMQQHGKTSNGHPPGLPAPEAAQ